MGVTFVPKGPQYEGIQWLLKHAYAGLFWDPGRGKTITVLEAFKILRDEGLVRNMLVTSSVDVIDGVWPEEIEKFDDLDLTYAMLRGPAHKREEEFNLDADVYLINNENLWWLQDTFGKRLGIDMLVVDESSKFRNGKVRKRVKKNRQGRTPRNAYSALVRMLPNFKRRVIMTGSPAPKSYLNLWPQAYIMDRGDTLEPTLTGYRNKYFLPEGYEGNTWILRDGADVEIKRALGRRVHRAERQNDVPIEFFDLEVKLPPKAKAAYDELEREFITEWRGKTLLAANAAAATTKLRQAANGAVYYDDKRSWTLVHDRKVVALAELIDELQGSPLLIVTAFDHDHQMMAKAGLDIPRYAGSRRQKAEMKAAWNAGELRAMSAQIQSVSHGLNLQMGGSNIAFYGLTFDLDTYEQAYQRLWRSGQKNAVIVYNIVAENTIDEVMYEVLESRSRSQKDLLGALKRRYGPELRLAA